MSNLPDNMSRRDWQHVNGDEGCEGCDCNGDAVKMNEDGWECEHRPPCGCELCACNCHSEPNYLYD